MTNRFLKSIGLAVIGMVASMTSGAWADTYFDEAGTALYRQEPEGRGSGEETLDLANIINGVLNVEAVFAVFHENEALRDLDTLSCGEIGVKDLSKGGGSTGEYCCRLLWEIEGRDLMASPGIKKSMGGALGGWDEHKRSRLRSKEQFYDYCCKLSDDENKPEEKYVFCQTRAQEKAGCVRGELNNGSDLDGAMSACEVGCDPKFYGTMKHNEDEKYSDEEIDNLVRKCSMEDVEWAPTTTVPGAEEFAPVVPASIRDF